MTHRASAFGARLTLTLGCVVLLFSFVDCGGGTSSSPPPPPPPPPTPSLVVAPTLVSFSTSAGASNPSAQTFTITSSTSSALNWTATISTVAGGNWLTVSPISGTTPTTVTVSANSAGLGATSFSGSVVLAASSSTVTVNVNLQLASPQPPYFTSSQSFLLPPQGPITITLPDGSLMPGASNQLLVDLDGGATTSDMQAVASAINAANAKVVGEIPLMRELEVQVADPGTIARLILSLEILPKVIHVGPNFFSGTLDQRLLGCTNTGPSTAWLQADNLGPTIRPASSDDIVMCVVDCFDPQRCSIPGVGATHGDIVAAIIRDAAGNDAAGNPLFLPGKNLFEIDTSIFPGTDFAPYKDAITKCVQANPNKKVLVNMSISPIACNAEAAVDLAACANAQSEWYEQVNAATKEWVTQFGDNVLLVKSAGNAGPLSVKPLTSLSSCHMIPVGALDQTSPNVTLPPLDTVGSPIPVYAPACNISPVSLTTSSSVDGTSFAAPQVLGQLAAIWASIPGLTACQLGSQVFALPKLGSNQGANQTGAQLDGQALFNLAKSLRPAGQAPSNPLTPLPCPAMSVSPSSALLGVGTSVQLTATLTGVTTQPTFQYLTSNPSVATVDGNGNVTAVGSGIATISASAPGVTCVAQAAIVVPAEQYVGTFSIQISETSPNAPGWTPDPLTVTGTISSAPLQLVVAQSLLAAGAVSGIVTTGPGTITISIPALTCIACDPPVTIPAVNQSSPLPAATGPFSGITDGKLLSIPVDGFPPMTGTVSVLGSTIQVTLNWSVQISDGAGGTITIQESGTLTRQ